MTFVVGPILPNGVVAPKVWGDTLVLMTSLTFSGNYPANGEAIAAEIEKYFLEIGRGLIEEVTVTGTPGYMTTWDYESGKLRIYDTGASSGAVLAELAAGAYPAALTTNVKPKLKAIGR